MKRIGVSLSGGGVRATVFHLGVLARLAEANWLEQIAFLSTVSGGSLCAGLVYASNNFTWPSSRQYFDNIIPRARHLLTTRDLQSAMIWRALRSPLHLFQPRANYLSSLLQEMWHLTARLCDIPENPRWLINATTYETGKNWRFESFRMGDYVFGYTYNVKLPVSDAVAASSGFPGLIGPLELDTSGYHWSNYTSPSVDAQPLPDAGAGPDNKMEPVQAAYPRLHLWDGGAYDNFGLEGLFDPETGWRKQIDFLIASDASGKAKPEAYRPGFSALYRLITGIMMDQVRSLRARSIIERMVNHGDPGAFIEIGNSCEQVLRDCGREDSIATLSPECLKADEARAAANTPTSIRQLSEPEFDLLFRHGYEVANCTLHGRHPDEFPFLAFSASQCAGAMTRASGGN